MHRRRRSWAPNSDRERIVRRVVLVGQVRPSIALSFHCTCSLLLSVMLLSDRAHNNAAEVVSPEHPEEPIIEHRVSFFPILSEQRKLWLLTIIREERVTSLLDVGCGEGSLLWSLSNPAYWLPDTLPGFVYAHIRTLHGLDISAESLVHAEGAITPSPPTSYSLPRWESLSASLWHGGLQKVNEEFKGIECIVASEVIEHLPPRAFTAFAPVLLGYYAPRLLLMTTPSYLFNRLFVPPPSSPEKEDPWLTWGYASPTQPGRRMRHDDHQFEWTPAEAREWCTVVAGTWGYDLRLQGVGVATEEDPWGRTVEDVDVAEGGAGGCASLVVEFRRLEGEEANTTRMKVWETWCAGEGASYAEDEPHERVALIEHVAHERGGRPLPQEEITECTRQAMRGRRSADVQLGDIWDRVATACGGSRVALVEALDADVRFRVDKEDKDAQRWSIALLGVEGEEAQNWQEPVEDVQEYSNLEQSEEYDEGEDVDEADWAEEYPEVAPNNQENVWEPDEVSGTNNGWDTENEDGWGATTDRGGWGSSSNTGGWDTSDSPGDESGWGISDNAHEQ
ncbi:hypothetical protein PENSPDRAFT_284881 [Peniophora sp. CONT]|nr:hypothetical protein PENSPDRAFT_284881 [Peniophora sp. CONT]